MSMEQSHTLMRLVTWVHTKSREKHISHALNFKLCYTRYVKYYIRKAACTSVTHLSFKSSFTFPLAGFDLSSLVGFFIPLTTTHTRQ